MKSQRRTGFTLLELTVAVVLTAIMAVAVANVLRALLGEQRGDKVDRYPTTQLNAVLRQDLLNSQYYRIIPEGLQLLGSNGSDPRTGQPQLTEAQVTLAVKQTQQGGLLVRTEVPTTDSVQAASHSSPVWLGISAIRLETTYIENSAFEESVQPSLPVPVGWKRLPPTFDVVLFDNRGVVFTIESIAEVR